MKITPVGNHHGYMSENPEEHAELEELEHLCAHEPYPALVKLLADETEAWKSLMLAEQIVSDIEDYIFMEDLYR